jgi:hypothetical protein
MDGKLIERRLLRWYRGWLQVGRPRGRSSNPGSVKNFLHSFHTVSGVHPLGTSSSFSGSKAAGA